MNYNKIINDLKKENKRLKHQYELMQIRAVCNENKQDRINKAINYLKRNDLNKEELIKILEGDS